jgi:hypothetical protein
MTKRKQMKKLKRHKRVRKALNMIKNNTPASKVQGKLRVFDDRRRKQQRRK